MRQHPEQAARLAGVTFWKRLRIRLHAALIAFMGWDYMHGWNDSQRGVSS